MKATFFLYANKVVVPQYVFVIFVPQTHKYLYQPYIISLKRSSPITISDPPKSTFPVTDNDRYLSQNSIYISNCWNLYRGPRSLTTNVRAIIRNPSTNHQKKNVSRVVWKNAHNWNT